ncbi:hypothetical protein Cantr_03830 [Candida viswanathii]|uniref:RING-type domain-containing protein n=1 Tax=Candida viswanathii TaxID=5486 RepID=A0A367XN75_9ASCO|nr:hypothetical protein Cantr_03830 [Candida viswanathii]
MNADRVTTTGESRRKRRRIETSESPVEISSDSSQPEQVETEPSRAPVPVDVEVIEISDTEDEEEGERQRRRRELSRAAGSGVNLLQSAFPQRPARQPVQVGHNGNDVDDDDDEIQIIDINTTSPTPISRPDSRTATTTTTTAHVDADNEDSIEITSERVVPISERVSHRRLEDYDEDDEDDDDFDPTPDTLVFAGDGGRWTVMTNDRERRRFLVRDIDPDSGSSGSGNEAPRNRRDTPTPPSLLALTRPARFHTPVGDIELSQEDAPVQDGRRTRLGDVAQRRHIESRLRRAEERLRTVRASQDEVTRQSTDLRRRQAMLRQEHTRLVQERHQLRRRMEEGRVILPMNERRDVSNLSARNLDRLIEDAEYERNQLSAQRMELRRTQMTNLAIISECELRIEHLRSELRQINGGPQPGPVRGPAAAATPDFPHRHHPHSHYHSMHGPDSHPEGPWFPFRNGARRISRARPPSATGMLHYNTPQEFTRIQNRILHSGLGFLVHSVAAGGDFDADIESSIMRRIEEDTNRTINSRMASEAAFNKKVVEEREKQIAKEKPTHTSTISKDEHLVCELCNVELGEGVPEDFEGDSRYDGKLMHYCQEYQCTAPWFCVYPFTEVDIELSKRVFISKCGHMFCGRCVKNIGNRPKRSRKGSKEAKLESIKNPNIYAPLKCPEPDCGKRFTPRSFTEIYF